MQYDKLLASSVHLRSVVPSSAACMKDAAVDAAWNRSSCIASMHEAGKLTIFISAPIQALQMCRQVIGQALHHLHACQRSQIYHWTQTAPQETLV